ncbi:25179_t:CDS:2, partial [Gigaspora margarita]
NGSVQKKAPLEHPTNDLTAPYILHKRNPEYTNTCHICHNVSDKLHWAICPTSNPLF